MTLRFFSTKITARITLNSTRIQPDSKQNPAGTMVAISIIQNNSNNSKPLQLENEIIELRKENERIVKERAEYENAIQRALLKGVSSLNVEALKVLRCTPVPACCPPSTTM